MKKNGFAPLVIILVIAILGLGTYFVYKNSLHSSITSNIDHATSLKSSESTEDWKTFESTFGYSVKYPNDWKISAPGKSDPTNFYNPIFESPCDFDSGNVCSQMYISSVPYESDSSLGYPVINTEDKFDPDFNINPNDKVVNKVNLNIGSEPAIGFEHFRSNYAGSTKWEYVVVFNHENTRFTLTYDELIKNNPNNTPRDWKHKNIFDSILMSFKFKK